MFSNHFWAKAKEINSFWKAIDRGDIATVRRLVKGNSKLFWWARGDGKQPLDLYAEASRPNPRILDFLIAHETPAFGMEPDPVTTAVLAGNRETLQQFLERGFDPNGRAFDRFETPLHVAAENDQAELVSILLEAGADPGIESHGGKTPMETAKRLGNEDCVSILERHPAKRRVRFVNPRRPKATIELNLMDDLPAVRATIRKGVRAAKAKSRSRKITAVALHGSGYQGFVEIGFETMPFDAERPNCGAEVSMAKMARQEFPRWSEPYLENNRIIVHYGGAKPANQTTRATCDRMDEPFFRFLKSALKNAIEDGEFSSLPLAANCLFGVQTFFYHHCEFWDADDKKTS